MIKNKLYLIFIVLLSIFISSITISCNKPSVKYNGNIAESPELLYVDNNYGTIPNGININCAETIGMNTFYKIQDAIDKASPGSSIFISPGIYNETVTVSKSLNIYGENDKGAVIKGSLNVINKSAMVNIYNIEITNGPLGSNSRSIYNNGILSIYNAEKVAGIFNDSGVLNIYDSTISSNINDNGVEEILNLNGTLTIGHSKIYGNIASENNVDFYSNVEINASYNWWGDPTGPYNKKLNPDGNGISISENINFTPYYIDGNFNLTSRL